MDIATTMAAVNYFNMVNTWNMLAMQDTELFTVTENGKEDEMMSTLMMKKMTMTRMMKTRMTMTMRTKRKKN